MQRAVLLGMALIGVGAALSACSPDRKADERAILDGEKLWGGAYVTGDAKAVDALMADDFVGVEPTGGSYGKIQALVDVRKGPSTTTSDLVGPVTVRFYGNTAVAQGSESGTEGLPEKKPFQRVFLDVWVKQAGRWKIVAAQDLDPNARPPVDAPPAP